MIDELVLEAESQFKRARQYHQAGLGPRALVEYHEGLEKLLRWAMVRDGADAAEALDPARVTWEELINYLDARHALPRQACSFLSQMTYLYNQIRAGGHPELNTMTMESYSQLVTGVFRRLFPRDEAERNEVQMRATFARPQPASDVAARPAERAHDTPILVPVAPPPTPAAMAAATLPAPPGRPAWVEQLLNQGGAPEDVNLPAPARAAGPPGDRQEQAASRRVAAADPMGLNPRGDQHHAPDPLGLGAHHEHPAANPPPASLENRAIEAGRRLREMRLQGQDYCPHCRKAIPITSGTCPHCNYDLDAHRARQRAAQPPAAGGFLGRLLRRR